jgi:hypothetical protein
VGYVLSTTVLYASCITTILFIVSKSEERGIKSFTKRNPEVLIATIIVIGSFILVEIVAEFVMAVIWTVNVKHYVIGFIVFAAAIVYYGPGIVSLFMVGKKILYYNKVLGRKDIAITNESNKLDIMDTKKFDTIFKCFEWITAYFTYVLLYSFFPAFVLAFAYPTRVITIFAFIATFLILSIVFLTTFIKKLGVIFKDVRFIKVIVSIIILMFLLLYFFLFIFALLYSLVIGRASVVSSAPLAVLSLLPSILISIAAWVMKSTMLDNDNERNDKKDDGNNELEIDGELRCITSSKQLKEMDTNLNKEGDVTQNEQSRSASSEANQDGEVIANAMLVQDEGSEEKEVEEESQDREVINKQEQQKGESCGNEKELDTKV